MNIKCFKCSKNAMWYYLPSCSRKEEERYFCDDHISRGCSCNIDSSGKEETDDLGRLLPCIEYDFNEKGFNIKMNELKFNKNLDKLNTEQLKIVARWEQEALTRAQICEQSINDTAESFALKMRNADTDICEHGRSTSGNCSACDEIEMILYPELFNQDDE